MQQTFRVKAVWDAQAEYSPFVLSVLRLQARCALRSGPTASLPPFVLSVAERSRRMNEGIRLP